MSMYDSYTYEVKAIHPSGLISYDGGQATGVRRFKVPCRNANEFALRMLGKYYSATENFLIPVLPIRWPYNPEGTTITADGQFNLIATGFSIEPHCVPCFNMQYGEGETLYDDITNPESITQLETYYGAVWPGTAGESDDDCSCTVVVQYTESPYDCTWYENESIMDNTAISVERNPSYEMYTLPSRALAWKDIADGPDKALKPDSHAYIIVPKADIIIHWHNVPVSQLCNIETHLSAFRGKVNQESFDSVIHCSDEYDLPGVTDTGAADCDQYEAETLLLVDFAEDRSKRTNCFGPMDTTTIKIYLKHKRIVDTSDSDAVKGWNHLWFDRGSGYGSVGKMWERVVVDNDTVADEDLFKLVSFSNLLNPTL